MASHGTDVEGLLRAPQARFSLALSQIQTRTDTFPRKQSEDEHLIQDGATIPSEDFCST